MSEKYDLIVIGAGPAGLMASVVAAEGGLKVLLVERKKNVSKVTRSCCSMWITEAMTHGESISVEEGRVVFPRNDFSLPYTGDMIPLVQYQRLSPGGKEIVFENTREPVSIAFDKEDLLAKLLVQAESLGVNVASGTLCVDVADEEEKVSVKLRDGEGEREEHGSCLILADGVNSPMGAKLGFDKERTYFGRFQVLSYFFDKVECPYPPSFMNFVGAGHLNGGVGNVYMLPKPGIKKDNRSVFEVTIGSPEADLISLPDKMRYFIEESHYFRWFKNAKRVAANSAILDFRTPLVTPAKGRTLVAGDAAAFIETYVQGALIYGRSAGKAVIGKIKEGKDFSEYINLWKDTFGYNQPGEIEKSTQAYGISSFSDDELDYIFGLTEGEKREGYVNEFNDFERIMGAFYAHIETMRKEKPELADKLESHFGKSEVRDSLQITKSKI
jgi:flavin-dependent dehydrogenase